MRDDVTRDGVTREPLGLLNCSELWLDTGTVTGMAKLGAGTADWTENEGAGSGRGDPAPWQPKGLRAELRVPGPAARGLPSGPSGVLPAPPPRTDTAGSGTRLRPLRQAQAPPEPLVEGVSPQPGGTAGSG